MIRLHIQSNKHGLLHKDFTTQEELDQYLVDIKDHWGELEHTVVIQEAVLAVLDESGAEITPAVPEVTELVPATVVYTQEDITAQLEQEAINAEALAYLASTDYLIIREMDSGVACPVEIKNKRAEARSKIIK